LQIRTLQTPHTAHCSPGLPVIAALLGKTACKYQRAHARLILDWSKRRSSIPKQGIRPANPRYSRHMLLMPVARRYNSFAAAQRLDVSLGNLHFGVAAWLCRVHRGSDAAEMQTHYRPLRVRKHQNGDLAASQVLLILDILLCREQYFEAGRTSGLLHKLLHRRFPEPPEMHQNGCSPPILHNNIRKVGSFRNRQVASSTLALGSRNLLVQPVRSTRKRIQTLLKVCDGDDHVHYLCYLLTDRPSGQGNAPIERTAA